MEHVDEVIKCTLRSQKASVAFPLIDSIGLPVTEREFLQTLLCAVAESLKCNMGMNGKNNSQLLSLTIYLPPMKAALYEVSKQGYPYNNMCTSILLLNHVYIEGPTINTQKLDCAPILAQ